jgi:hypothetical protein
MAMVDIKLLEKILKEFEQENEEDPIEDPEYIKGIVFIADEMRTLDENYFAKGVVDFIREYDRRRKKKMGKS